MPNEVFQLVRRGGPDLDSVLTRLADINVKDEDGQSLLHEAVSFGNVAAGKMVIALGIDVNAKDRNGQTALHYVGAHHASELAREILSHGGKCSASDSHGNTPLWTAVFNAKGRYETVIALLEFDCLAVADQKNNYGRSPIDFARQIGDQTLLRLLGEGE